MELQLQLATELPHLHGWKWYRWAREFYESRDKINLLCAANQISKSSTQIRKCITWATDRALWETLWNRPPTQFWYLYPSRDVATAEWDTKWVQFMPRGRYKDDPIYGWKEKRNKEGIHSVHFNSGVIIYFKTYSQDPKLLQTGTCDALFCDEELPEEHYNELIFRISASNGYFHMVFTATLGQEFWRKTMEPEESEQELLPEARKWCISLYQCQEYEDGTPSHWTKERIQIVLNRCLSQAEVLRRVYGRFVYEGGGKKYSHFNIKKHVIAGHPLPSTWYTYAGVDIGSGGKANHPAAIAFIKVDPTYRQGRVVLTWRGDGLVTTAGDVLEKYNSLVREHGLNVTQAFYDHSSKDFDTIQSRAGGSFVAAEKSHDIGEHVLNTLFKNDALFLYDSSETQKLATELISLKKDTAKEKAKDDLCDAVRYSVTKIPWDWEFLTGMAPTPEAREKAQKDLTADELLLLEVKARREEMDEHYRTEEARLEDEFNEWNEASGN